MSSFGPPAVVGPPTRKTLDFDPADLSRVHAWYACYTNSRCEKKVELLLRRRGIESFLPLAEQERQWHDRRKRVAFPLFPSYVFARIDATQALPVLQTPGVAAIVRFAGRLSPIPDDEIENIVRFASALNDNGIAAPPLVAFERGDRVRIVSGPFEGVAAVVVEMRGRRRVLVGLRDIGLAFDVDVPVQCLETC